MEASQPAYPGWMKLARPSEILVKQILIQNRQSVYMQTGWKRARNELETSQPAPPRSWFQNRDPGGASYFFSHVNALARGTRLGDKRCSACGQIIRYHLHRFVYTHSCTKRESTSRRATITFTISLPLSFQLAKCVHINSSLFQPGLI